MSNPGNDNRLEQLSREAADGYTPPGNASWEKMEAALNQVMPVQEKKRHRFIFWWIFPILIAGAGLFYITMPKTSELSTNNLVIAEESPATASSKENSKKIEPEAIKEPGATVSQDEYANAVAIPDHPKSSALQYHKRTEQKITHISSGNIINTAITAKQTQSSSNTDIVQKTAIVQEEKAKTRLTNSETVKNNSITNAVVTNNQQQGFIIRATADSGNAKITDGIIEKAVNNIDSASKDNLNTSTNIPAAKKAADSRFSIAFIAGVDASTVKFKYSDKAGINIGVLAGYHFNNRWSVHTGALFTRKNYSVAGEDFTVPKNSWLANYKISMVDGYCNMWEVPLLLRYQFNGSGTRGFFASAGLSSYFMTRENYNYTYYWNSQLVTRNNNYSTGNTYLLSIFRLSAGWRKSIGKGTSVLIEPYAALPLGGVGYGSIRLSSFGLNFSLQIRQPSKKK